MSKNQKSKQYSNHSKSIQKNNSHDLLQYYKNKVDQLYQQRLSWLSKFDQCNSKLKNKHSLKQTLLNQKNQQRQLTRNLIHHQIALFDQKLNVLRMERQNLKYDYNDAEELIKISELMKQYPEQIEKQLPCYNVNFQNGQTIQNQLNIHNSKQKRQNSSIAKRKPSIGNNYNIKNNLSHNQNQNQRKSLNQNNKFNNNNNKVNQGKINVQQLLQREIIELKKNQQEQVQTMNQQINKLEELINRTKSEQNQKLTKEREIVDQLEKQYKLLEKKHKLLAEEYFNGRRQLKVQKDNLKKENQDLIKKNSILQEKVNKEIKVYEKQNKAKQTLIIRKSQDFQENYKAKMRAKEKNLQALKENYQKMQTICIEKVNKLEKALKKAKSKLNQAEQRRQFLISQLREQLHSLQKQVQQQKNQREQRQLKMKIKIQKEKAKNEKLRQRQEKEQARLQRNRFVDEAYKKTIKKSKSKSRNKKIDLEKYKPAKKDIYGKDGQQSQDDQSIEMDDLENIKKQIGELQSKIAADTK